MFLRDDAADRQLQRLTAKNQRQGSIHSWSSETTTASSSFKSKEDGRVTTGNNKNGGDALLESLIRDLSFWDSIPPSSSNSTTKWIFSFPSPLPQRPSTKTQSSSHYYQHRQPQHQSLQRRRSSMETASSSRDHRHYNSNNNRSRRMRDEKYDQQNSSGRERSRRGSITGDNNNEQIWQPVPSPQWKSAVDPTTGRTYWYDSVTRRTQWEKPAEVRHYEKQKKALRRKQDRFFFQIMESNILSSLARGEFLPGVPKAEMEPTGPPLEPRNTKAPLNTRSVRTLSMMDDTILAELRDDVVTPEEFNRALHLQAQQQQKQQQQQQQASRTTKPSGSSRGRPPLPGAGGNRSFNNDRSRSRSRTRTQGVDGTDSSQQGGQPPQQQPISTNKTNSGLRLPPNGKPPSSGTHNSNNTGTNGDPRSLPLNNKNPPSRTLSANEGLDTLAGEHLLDGKILRAEIETVSGNSDSPHDNNAITPSKNHVRRNTGGTIYVEGTMSNPDVESTIKCVCGVYRAHLVQAMDQHNKSPVSVMNKSLNMEIFNDRYHLPVTWKHNTEQETLPSLWDIVEFYQEFFKRSQMEFDTIIMSLIYVERLIKTTCISPGPENWRSIMFSCMVLASKVWDDLSMWNVDFSNVASAQSQGMSLFTLQRVNQLELILLKSLAFDVRVSASEYAKYYFLIRTMLMRTGLLEGAAEPLGKADAKGLENRTSQYQDSKLGGGSSNERDRRVQSMCDYSWLNQKTSTDPVCP